MSTRRSHNKSRAGCAQCKERRIKCDEGHPLCGGCIKRELGCSFNGTGSVSPGPKAGIQMPSSEAELELMHHYAVWTYRTCCHSTLPLSWWQETLPVMAIGHEPLLHAVLALTSLHVAYRRPDEAAKYVATAVAHHHRTLATLPKYIGKLSREQNDACFWASALLGVITLAMSNTPSGRQGPAVTVLGDLTTHWRGAHAMWPGATTSDGTGGQSMGHGQLRNAGCVSILRRAEACLMRGRANMSPEMQEVYVDAIRHLLKAVADFEARGNASGILSWYPCIDRKLLEGLSAGTAEASFVVILYGFVLDAVKDIWYIQDLGTRIVQELTPVVPLWDRDLVVLTNAVRENISS